MAKKRGAGHQGQGGVLVNFGCVFSAEDETILASGDCDAYPDGARFFACATFSATGTKARAEAGIPPWGSSDTGIAIAFGASADVYMEAVTEQGELLGRSETTTVTDV